MFVLGVNSGPHDGSAALLLDGELIVMVEQERVSRNKRAIGESPSAAIYACLGEAGITLEEVAAVAVGWDVPQLVETEGRDLDLEAFRSWLFSVDVSERRIPPIRFIPHHVAHAASAVWASGFDRSAVLVIDGRGEIHATTIALGTASEISIIRQWDTSYSLGHFYGFAAEWVGMTVWDAGKLMGLAAYGSPSQSIPLGKTDDGYSFLGAPTPNPRVPYRYYQLRSFLQKEFRTHNYPFTAGNSAEPMAHASFASSVQKAVEEVVFHLALMAKESSSADCLALAGGVALNCTMNGHLARSGIFSEIYVPPVPHDAGVSLGAALIVDKQMVPARTWSNRLLHPFWGPRVNRKDVEASIRMSGLSTVKMNEPELVSTVAQLLAAGRIVGWCQGRSEIGPRALGARSILADPRDRAQLVRLNSIKGREVWRPLAPSVLEEHANQLFGALPSPSEFMLASCPVRPESQRLIPAAVHVDGSARPQLVRKSINRKLWMVIEEFRELTGVPAVINTSFNLAGEPIVFSPSDAVSTFCRSELDVLVIEDYLVLKEDNLAYREGPKSSKPMQEITFTPWDAGGARQH